MRLTGTATFRLVVVCDHDSGERPQGFTAAENIRVAGEPHRGSLDVADGRSL
jgi:hypothetical protein